MNYCPAANMPSSTINHIPSSTASIAPPPTVSTLQPTPSSSASQPSLQEPSQIHLPSSPHRTLRKLASAHNLGSPVAVTGSLRAASITNPPSLITQQRAQHQQHQQHQQPQLPQPQPSNHPLSHSHSHSSYGSLRQQQQQFGLSSVRQRNVSSTVGSSVLGISNRSPTRGRASSDAPTLHQLNAAAAAAAMSSHALRNSGALTRRNIAYDHLALERLVRDGPPDSDFESALESARYKVLQQEVKSDTDGMSNLRIYVWLIMLDAPILSTDEYLDLVHRGASPAYSKIRNDTFRTLTTDPLFRRRVSEASLIRLLNAIAWKLHDTRPHAHVHGPATTTTGSRPQLPPPETPTRSPHRGGAHASHSSSPAAKNRARALTLTTEGSEGGSSSNNMAPLEPGTYVQGMNVLAAPFLYAARSEAEAFVAFHRLLTRECPGYIRGAMDGVHRGLRLVDKVLGIVDARLSMYLVSKGLQAELYAFPSVLTLCACTPPLPEVLRLWDFLFAYGPHLNIVCIAAQLVIHRDEIMASANPSHFLRTFPALNAEKTQAMTLVLLGKLPDDVYAEIVSHAM